MVDFFLYHLEKPLVPILPIFGRSITKNGSTIIKFIIKVCWFFFFSVVTFLEKHSFTYWNYELVLNRIVGTFLNLIIFLFKHVVRFSIFEGFTFLSYNCNFSLYENECCSVASNQIELSVCLHWEQKRKNCVSMQWIKTDKTFQTELTGFVNQSRSCRCCCQFVWSQRFRK